MEKTGMPRPIDISEVQALNVLAVYLIHQKENEVQNAGRQRQEGRLDFLFEHIKIVLTRRLKYTIMTEQEIWDLLAELLAKPDKRTRELANRLRVWFSEYYD